MVRSENIVSDPFAQSFHLYLLCRRSAGVYYLSQSYPAYCLIINIFKCMHNLFPYHSLITYALSLHIFQRIK